MEFEWDDDKDAANRAKHGIGLAKAAHLDWDTAQEELDTRKNYGEPRSIAYAYLGNRLYVCVYTLRGRARRIISLRKANRREGNAYGTRNDRI